MNLKDSAMNKCPICGAKSQKLLTALNILYHKCTECNFLFADNNMIENFNKDFYNSEEYYKEEDNWPKEERLALFHILIKFIKKNLKYFTNPKILDFGAGIKDLKEKSALYNRITFYDPSFSDTLLTDKKDLMQKSFDAIICTEVIEHVSNTLGLFEEIAGYLKKGGICTATTLLHDYKFKLEYLDPTVGHISIHSKKSIVLAAQKTGLKYEIVPTPGYESDFYLHLFTKI